MMAQAFRPSLIFVLTLLASGCGQADPPPGPGPTSADEARALSEAAEMIEEARAPAPPSAGAEEPQEDGEAGEPVAAP